MKKMDTIMKNMIPTKMIIIKMLQQSMQRSGAWFGSLVWTGAVGLVFGGPIGLAAGATVGGIMAYEFEKHIWNKILDVVKRESENQPTLDSIDHYYHSS